MPLGKKGIHDLLSPKIVDKRKARRLAGLEAAKARQAALAEGKPDPSIPVAVDNYQVNSPLFGPHKIKKKEVEVVLREISPQEGKPTVNAKPAEHLVHKPGADKIIMDPADGAINPMKNKKTKGRRRKKNVKQKTEKTVSRSNPEPESGV